MKDGHLPDTNGPVYQVNINAPPPSQPPGHPQLQPPGYPPPQTAGYPQPQAPGYPQPQAPGYPEPQAYGYPPESSPQQQVTVVYTPKKPSRPWLASQQKQGQIQPEPVGPPVVPRRNRTKKCCLVFGIILIVLIIAAIVVYFGFFFDVEDAEKKEYKRVDLGDAWNYLDGELDDFGVSETDRQNEWNELLEEWRQRVSSCQTVGNSIERCNTEYEVKDGTSYKFFNRRRADILKRFIKLAKAAGASSGRRKNARKEFRKRWRKELNFSGGPYWYRKSGGLWHRRRNSLHIIWRENTPKFEEKIKFKLP